MSSSYVLYNCPMEKILPNTFFTMSMARMFFILVLLEKSYKSSIMGIAHKTVLYSFNNSIKEMCLESSYL